MSLKSLSAPLALLLSALCVLPFARAQGPAVDLGHPDIIFFHGDFLTGAHLTPNDHSHTPARVTAIAVHNQYVQYIGDDQEVLALAVPSTTLVDMHGAFAMPGFNDAHTHIASGGLQRLTVDLDNVPSLAAMQAKVKTYAATLAPGQWIVGAGWDHTKWKRATLPTRQDLDRVSAGHPTYLERTDGHIALLNSAALTALGITATTPVPTGGAVDLDPKTHEPTGIVRDAALTLVRPRLPRPDAATRRKALTLALHDAVSHGVTSIQDFSDYEDFQALAAMEADNQLPIRVTEWIPFDLPLDTLGKYRGSHPTNDPYLHTGMLKAFMDGSLGSRTAALVAPYTDDPTNSGLPRYTQEQLNKLTIERALAGWQMGFHAIGDRANSMALDAFTVAKEELKKKYTHGKPISDEDWDKVDRTRWRIEHAQVLVPSDFDRYRKLHIVASMQPVHLLTDMAWAGQRLGPERSKYAYAWKSFLDHGVHLAFGTDYPVESISPFRGLYAAVTRMNEAGTQTFEPQEKLTLDQAIYAYTQGSAYADYSDFSKGELVPGQYADFIVLDRDITKSTPRQILGTNVLRTIVGGITRYSR